MQKSQESKQKIHFIDIGGIGISALAKFYLTRGVETSGWDALESENIEELRKLGAKIIIGNERELNSPFLSPRFGEADGNEKIVDLVVYSAAVPQDNPELVEARRRGIKCQTYAQALGELTKKYYTIAISGTHGKSTTTAMIGLILEHAGFDPTVIVGTKVRWQAPQNPPSSYFAGEAGQPSLKKEGATNCRIGKSKYLVIEADEYAASFLNYWPKIVVLTNIEEDHLDYYTGGLPQIIETFKEYVGHLGRDGVLVANEEDRNIKKIVKVLKFKVKSYSSKLKIDGLKLKIPGAHNLSNAAAAATAARILGIADKIIIEALNNFTGTWRRMEFKGEINGAKIYDDYGHHPTEIKATLAGAIELLTKNQKLKTRNYLWCIFQPHQYQRTYQLFNKFADSFADADKIIILPIYSVAGREKKEIIQKVNSQKLVKAIKEKSKKEVLYFDSFKTTADYLSRELKRSDIAIIMGAGDIYKLTQELFGRQK